MLNSFLIPFAFILMGLKESKLVVHMIKGIQKNIKISSLKLKVCES